jgi:alpha-tubulin suppressor-like RCC1 family protein
MLGDNTTTQRSTPVTTFAGGNNWKSVACGDIHVLAIKTDGSLWVWGRGADGQLGTNNTADRSTPVTTFIGGNDWKSIAGGVQHSAAVKTDGTLWTWGTNSEGQLGINNADQKNTPVTTFTGGTNWKSVACGRSHTIALKTDGTLWTWGVGEDGRLGNFATTNRSTPVTTFAGGNNWKSVGGGGDNHTAAIKTDGSLWAWGQNSFGILGTNDSTTRSTPVTTFAGGNNWKSVSCGNIHTAAIKSGLNVDLS